MRRLFWIVPAGLLLAVVIAATAVWYVTEQQMRAELSAWVAARRAEGWAISAVAPSAGGWPIEATLTLRDFEISGGNADIPSGLSWRADSVVLELTPKDRHSLHIEATGLQHLRIGDLPGIAYIANRLELLVPLQAAPVAQPLSLRGEGLRAHVAIGEAEESMTIQSLAADLVLHPDAGRGQPALALSGTAEDLALPSKVDWALGPRIRSLGLEVALDGPVSDAPTVTERATAWRDGKGVVHVSHLTLHWGALDLTAQARLGLDAQMQPTAQATAEVAGYAQTLDALARHGVISDSAAVAAKAMLSLIAATPASGGPSEVEVPLSLQDGTLAMHQIPMLRLPHLDWPPS